MVSIPKTEQTSRYFEKNDTSQIPNTDTDIGMGDTKYTDN